MTGLVPVVDWQLLAWYITLIAVPFIIGTAEILRQTSRRNRKEPRHEPAVRHRLRRHPRQHRPPP